MSYCNYEDVVKMTRVNAKKLGYKEEAEFRSLITEWILQAEGFIDSYCKRNWKNYYDENDCLVTVKVPPVIKNVCIRLVSNIIAFHFKRRDDPVRKVNEFSVKVFESDVFTDDLKKDLKPYRKPSRVAIFKI